MDESAPHDLHRFDVPTEEGGRRLDQFLVARLPEFSRAFLQKLIAEGLVRVQGRPAKRSRCVRPGERIEIELVAPPADEIEPEDLPLDILHEDDHILVVNKPAGMTVHPPRGGIGGTLVNALVFHCPQLSDMNTPLRPGIVHRLDRDTSGVLVTAKTNQAHAHLVEQFAARTVGKTYLAVVRGEMAFDNGEIRTGIRRHARRREMMTVCQLGGRRAVTHYQAAERFRGFTAVEVFPRTGRTHQIRVHLRYAGHPIVADAMYGGGDACYRSTLLGESGPAAAEAPLIERQALHALAIRLAHPVTGASVSFRAEPPEDFVGLMAALRECRRLPEAE